jgi:hypothetical protein
MSLPRERCANCGTRWVLGVNSPHKAYVCDNHHTKHFKHTREPGHTCAMWSPGVWEEFLRKRAGK